MIGIQAHRQEKIADHVFLPRPPLDGEVGQRESIRHFRGTDNGNELGLGWLGGHGGSLGWLGGHGGSLPVLFPPARGLWAQVSIPVPELLIGSACNRHLTPQLPDESDPPIEPFARLVWQRQREASWCHFSDDSAMLIGTQRNEGPDLTEWVNAMVLVRRAM
jgi:hypothetical protein